MPAVVAELGVDGAIGVDVVIGLPVAVQLDAAASSDPSCDLAGQDSPPQVSESTSGERRAAGCEVSTFSGGRTTAQAWEHEIDAGGAIGVDVQAIGVDGGEIEAPVALQLAAAASSDSSSDLAGQGSPPQVSESA